MPNFSFLGYVEVVFPWWKKKEKKYEESAVLEATLAQLKSSGIEFELELG